MRYFFHILAAIFCGTTLFAETNCAKHSHHQSVQFSVSKEKIHFSETGLLLEINNTFIPIDSLSFNPDAHQYIASTILQPDGKCFYGHPSYSTLGTYPSKSFQSILCAF